jgi:hypothetical protein
MLCLDANPDRRDEKPATNRLSYGTAFDSVTIITVLLKLNTKIKKDIGFGARPACCSVGTG